MSGADEAIDGTLSSAPLGRKEQGKAAVQGFRFATPLATVVRPDGAEVSATSPYSSPAVIEHLPPIGMLASANGPAIDLWVTKLRQTRGIIVGARSFLDLVDRIACSGYVYTMKSACSRWWREPESGKIAIVLGLCVLAVVIAVWTHRPVPVEPPSVVRIKPMVTPQEMGGVLVEAQRGRQRRR